MITLLCRSSKYPCPDLMPCSTHLHPAVFLSGPSCTFQQPNCVRAPCVSPTATALSGFMTLWLRLCGRVGQDNLCRLLISGRGTFYSICSSRVCLLEQALVTQRLVWCSRHSISILTPQQAFALARHPCRSYVRLFNTACASR